MKLFLAAVVLALPAAAELPEFYKQVYRVVFVVPDLEKASAAWKRSGVVQMNPPMEVDIASVYRGTERQTKFRWAEGWFGNVEAGWVEPIGDCAAFSEYLKKHGPGVLSLVHRVSTAQEMDAEIERMRALGVKVLQSGPMDDAGGRYVLFDTEPEGKYVLGLMYVGGRPSPPPEARPVTQFAFIVRDHAPVSKYWARLGWPEMQITKPQLHALQYLGKPAQYSAPLGWMRHGKVPYEWIMPVQGPSTWHTHLDKHGESLHHMAFNVDDMDAATADWTRRGFPYVMGGAWGEPGKQGYGRFAYVDAQSAGGVDVELLWNYRPAK